MLYHIRNGRLVEDILKEGIERLNDLMQETQVCKWLLGIIDHQFNHL